MHGNLEDNQLRTMASETVDPIDWSHPHPHGQDQGLLQLQAGLGVCEWSPEGLYDKSVSLIPNADKILKLVKKKTE